MADISFIIGSGFSIPAGLKSAFELNERLKKIDSTEIGVDSSEIAWFLNGQHNPNGWWEGIGERLFIQKFLEFYNSKILGGKGNFDYEIFYDYYQELKIKNQYPEELKTIIQEINAENFYALDMEQMLFKFDSYFNQLVANLLSKKFKKVHHCKPYPAAFGGFLNLLEQLSEYNAINIHSLNHDLYLESLSPSDSIQGEFDDGFEENGSPYYGKLENECEDYNVRLSRFTNKFTKKFRLFKLHGSIDHYWVGQGNDFDLLKLKYAISPHYIYKEIIDGDMAEYFDRPTQVYPDFLSGKEYKTNRYSKGDYYPKVFEHFENNLANSNSLIIIGYGFRDSEINKYIGDFSEFDSKKIFAVGMGEQPHKHFIFKKKNIVYKGGGVENMDYNYIAQNVV